MVRKTKQTFTKIFSSGDIAYSMETKESCLKFRPAKCEIKPALPKVIVSSLFHQCSQQKKVLEKHLLYPVTWSEELLASEKGDIDFLFQSSNTKLSPIIISSFTSRSVVHLYTCVWSVELSCFSPNSGQMKSSPAVSAHLHKRAL